jgi:hypothetical protein
MTDDSVNAPLAGMGPHLRGASPPFTFSGHAAFAASEVSNTPAGGLSQAGHAGILLRWRADRDSAIGLLPHPLQPVDHSDQIYLFLNQTQTGKSREFIVSESPQLMNWHEALFMIPCSFNGRKTVFVWALYKDLDYDAGIILGLYRGRVNKAAHFSEHFPFAAQPANQEMARDTVATMIVSRMDEQIIRASFRAERELTTSEIQEAFDTEEFLNGTGIRYMPDWANPGGPPLVHDLVLSNRSLAPRGVARAWIGQADLAFGHSPDDELDLLTPQEMLPSYYIHLDYQSGPGLWEVIHDYLDRHVEGGRVVRTRSSDMGPYLRGSSPPFTPSGTAAYTRHAQPGAGHGLDVAHIGLLLRWEAAAERVTALLPRPLEPSPDSGRPFALLSQVQLGPLGDAGESVNPHHMNWHEARFSIPCICAGQDALFEFCVYREQDHGVVRGMFDGQAAKLASFHKTFPFTAQKLNASLAQGGVARFVASRYDERLVSAEFRATRELTEQDLTAFRPQLLFRRVGIRFWPDYARPGSPPLVHDLVSWQLGSGALTRIWAGDATISLSTSDYEELQLLAPHAMLESYFVCLHYRCAADACAVIHDYVANPLA